MVKYSKETLERMIKNQRGLCTMYINDMNKDSQYMATHNSNPADQHKEKLKRRDLQENS